MDIPRKPRTRRKIIIRIIIGVVLIAIIGAASFYVSKMEPAAPAVDRATVWIDTVRQGSMSRAIRGMGKLVPEEIRWIPATVDGLPVRAQANSQISLFRLSADGRTAERVKVRLGNTSVNTVEIQEGLKPGDQVILSDMSAHDGVDSIRLN